MVEEEGAFAEHQQEEAEKGSTEYQGKRDERDEDLHLSERRI